MILGMIILDIYLPNRYEQIFLVQGKGSKFKNFLRTSFVHIPLSRRRRNLYVLDLRDQRRFGAEVLIVRSVDVVQCDVI